MKKNFANSEMGLGLEPCPEMLQRENYLISIMIRVFHPTIGNKRNLEIHSVEGKTSDIMVHVVNEVKKFNTGDKISLNIRVQI